MRKLLIVAFLFIMTPFTQFVSAEEPKSGSVYEMYHKQDNSANESDEEQIANDGQAPVDNSKSESQQPAEKDVPFAQDEPSFFMILVQMMGALVVVISLIYILLRFVNKRTRSFRSNQTMQHIGGVPLGANKSVQMIKVGDQLFVLGVGESIQLIKEISDKEQIARLIDNQEQELTKMEEPILKLSQWISSRLFQKKQQPKNEFAFKELLNRQLKDVSASQQKVREAMKENKNE